jgi:hypothetical protein
MKAMVVEVLCMSVDWYLGSRAVSQRKFHIEKVGGPLGSEHNRIVHYASVENVIRYALPSMPPGQYNIHELDPVNMYRKPVKTTTAYRRSPE